MLSLKNCESTCICGMQSGDLVLVSHLGAIGCAWNTTDHHSIPIGPAKWLGLHASTKEKELTQSVYTQQQKKKNPLSPPTRNNKKNPLSRPTRINKRKRTYSVGRHASTKEKELTQSACVLFAVPALRTPPSSQIHTLRIIVVVVAVGVVLAVLVVVVASLLGVTGGGRGGAVGGQGQLGSVLLVHFVGVAVPAQQLVHRRLGKVLPHTERDKPFTWYVRSSLSRQSPASHGKRTNPSHDMFVHRCLGKVPPHTERDKPFTWYVRSSLSRQSPATHRKRQTLHMICSFIVVSAKSCLTRKETNPWFKQNFIQDKIKIQRIVMCSSTSCSL